MNDRIAFGTISKWFRVKEGNDIHYFMKESLGQTESTFEEGRADISHGNAPDQARIDSGEQMGAEIGNGTRIATIYDMEREDACIGHPPSNSGRFSFESEYYADVEAIILRTRFGKHQASSQTINEICLRGLMDKTILYTTVDDMRRAGFNIRKGLSWEQLTFETCRSIQSSDYLEGFRAIIVKYDNEGFFVYADGCASVAYYADMMEAAMTHAATGRVFGSTIVVIAGLTHAILMAEPGTDFVATLCKGMAVGLSASHRLLKIGYIDEDDRPVFPYGEIGLHIVEKDRSLFDAQDLQQMFNEDGMAYVKLDQGIIDCELSRMRRDRLAAHPAEPKQRFSFCYHLIEQGPDGIEGFAKRLVQEGTPTIRGVEHLRIGNFVTLDREEVEEIRSIQTLLRLYIEDDVASQPFSISIFGQPGSGKSFIVKQIAKSFHLDSQDTFTFNLSQMTSLENLVDAFHKVRDSCLKGNIPVVFFDEFDSHFEGEKLGWLKHFLSPMQDGTFLEGATVHTIGKSVFVFAGGTCHSMEEFMQLVKTDADSPSFDEMKMEVSVDTKIQDFISRLKGYLNVLGINPEGGDQELDQHLRLLEADGGMSDFDEKLYLRRAILLRAYLEQKVGLQSGENINIEENVLNAFLRVWRYTHGARSMETLIQTSDIMRGYNFSASYIYNNNLDIHVSADFLYHLDRDSSACLGNCS